MLREDTHGGVHSSGRRRQLSELKLKISTPLRLLQVLQSAGTFLQFRTIRHFHVVIYVSDNGIRIVFFFPVQARAVRSFAVVLRNEIPADDTLARAAASVMQLLGAVCILCLAIWESRWFHLTFSPGTSYSRWIPVVFRLIFIISRSKFSSRAYFAQLYETSLWIS